MLAAEAAALEEAPIRPAARELSEETAALDFSPYTGGRGPSARRDRLVLLADPPVLQAPQVQRAPVQQVLRGLSVPLDPVVRQEFPAASSERLSLRRARSPLQPESTSYCSKDTEGAVAVEAVQAELLLRPLEPTAAEAAAQHRTALSWCQSTLALRTQSRSALAATMERAEHRLPMAQMVCLDSQLLSVLSEAILPSSLAEAVAVEEQHFLQPIQLPVEQELPPGLATYSQMVLDS